MFFPFKIMAQELEGKQIWTDPITVQSKKGFGFDIKNYFGSYSNGMF